MLAIHLGLHSEARCKLYTQAIYCLKKYPCHHSHPFDYRVGEKREEIDCDELRLLLVNFRGRSPMCISSATAVRTEIRKVK